MTPYIFFLILVLCASPAWAANLAVTWTTQPGAQDSLDIAVWGGDAKGPDDPAAIRLTGAINTISRTIQGADFEKAFPKTDYYCSTARKKGDTTWWTYPDGTYECGRWIPAAIVIPPIDPPPVEPPPVDPPVVTFFTKAEVLALLEGTKAAMETKSGALIKQHNALVVGAIEVCLNRNKILKSCLNTLRDALKEVNP